ncbi:MAG: hypothetical protein ABR957_05505 [Terracidiphilus sp.]
MGACWLLAGALAPLILAAPPPAATNLTVDQLDQLLKQIHGQSDARVARQITGVKLTERASAERIARWEADLAGERSREALMVVADVSAFLAPPAAELPTTPAPDARTQQQILTRCRDYVNQIVPRLPNYFALRTTTSFEFTTAQKLVSQPLADSMFQQNPGPRVHYLALGPAKSSDSPEDQFFWLGSYAEEVTYRGRTEVVNATPGTNGPPRSPLYAMSTSGDFGSVLEVIVMDFQEDQIAWDHWEQGHSTQVSTGPLAVFRYAVPSERSHYAVSYPNEPPNFPAYHGEVAIDPESGAVRWITLLAIDSESGYFNESSQLVEFAPTEIAGVTYICPVHSVAIVRFFEAFEYENTAHTPIPSQISINDVAFTKHHLFRSESHILSGASKP